MDFLSSQNPEEVDIKILVEQYEEALANDRQPMIDQDEVDQIVNYYEGSGHYDKALQIIEAALEQHPYSGYILLKKAQVLFDLKICDRSLECLDQAALFEPGELGIYLLRSEVLTFQSSHQEALHVLDFAMDQAVDLEVADVWLHMADVYEDWEKYHEVYRCLRECLQIDKINEEALSRINYCMELTEQYEDAVNLHKSIIDAHPYSFWAWYNLSYAYASLHLYEKAIDALEYVLAIDEDVNYAYKDMAQYYHELGAYSAALEAISIYCKRTKPEADTFLLEGKCHFELKNLRASRYCFRKAIRTNPSSHEAFYNLGMTYILEEKWPQAVQNLKKCVELYPDNIDYLERLAEVALQVEDFDEVRYCCSRAIRLNTKYTRIYITLALSHLFNEEAGHAIEIIEKGIAACENSVKLRYIRAALLLLTNKRKKAFLELEALLEATPQEHTVIFRYFPFLEEDNGLTSLLERFDTQN